MNSALIDFATEADLPFMADLLGELFSLESDFSADRDKQLAGLRLILGSHDRGRLFVLRVDGEVAGMANALITVSTAEGGRAVLLEDVIIRADLRGLGYGRRLVERVMDWARSEGCKRVTLMADAENEAALAFYERLGFASSGMKVLRRTLLC